MRAVLTLALLLPATLAAQSTQPDLEARLLKKPLYLRGLWQQDHLKFDATGTLTSKSSPIPFTLAGMDVTRIRFKSDKLILEGHRVGLLFDKAGDLHRTGLEHESIDIEIVAPSSGDYAPALNAIFAQDLAVLIPAMPLEWQSYAAKHFISQPPPPEPSSQSPSADPAHRVGGGVTPPKVLFAPEPHFTPYAGAESWLGYPLYPFAAKYSNDAG